MSVQIHCPKCGRILGDTDKSLDGVRLNCPRCKVVDVKIVVSNFKDYLKGEKK